MWREEYATARDALLPRRKKDGPNLTHGGYKSCECTTHRIVLFGIRGLCGNRRQEECPHSPGYDRYVADFERFNNSLRAWRAQRAKRDGDVQGGAHHDDGEVHHHDQREEDARHDQREGVPALAVCHRHTSRVLQPKACAIKLTLGAARNPLSSGTPPTIPLGC